MVIAICDDEEAIRKDIGRKAREIIPGADIDTYASAEELLVGESPDILLLDIQMEGMDGMDAAKKLRERSADTVLIFITAIKEHVYEAFDVGAFHYLVKPFSDEKFKEVLVKAVEDVRKRREHENGTQTRHIIVHDGILSISIDTGEIVFAEVLNRTVTIHLKNRDISYRGSICELADQVGKGFFQTHRAFLVNMRYVTSYSSAGIETPRGTVTVARGNLRHFIKAFMEYMRTEND